MSQTCLLLSLPFLPTLFHERKMNTGGAIRVCMLEGPYAKMTELGFPLSLAVELQSCGLRLDSSLWTARLSNGGSIKCTPWVQHSKR